jgi:hypothetical protein
MYFLIDVEPYQRLDVRDPEDSTVSEAIESVYRAGPAVRIHMAPGTWIRLPMSGGVSDIYNDVIRMLRNLEQGVYPFEITFLCSSFTAIWRFSESTGVLAIGTSWSAVDGTSNGSEIRDACFNHAISQIVVQKQKFVTEWQKLLTTIKHDLLYAGYGSNLGNFEYLEQFD